MIIVKDYHIKLPQYLHSTPRYTTDQEFVVSKVFDVFCTLVKNTVKTGIL